MRARDRRRTRAPWSSAAALAVAASSLVVGCEPRTATQVDVVLQAEPGVRAVTRSVEVTVIGRGTGGEEAPSEFVLPGSFPITTVIVPREGDASRTFLYSAAALDDAGRAVVRARLVAGFHPWARTRLDIVLEDACRGVECPATQTCRGGLCVGLEIPGDAGTSDAGTGVGDAGTDARIDAWACRCDDGRRCNGEERCAADGSCIAGTPVTCSPRACETLACDEADGTCVQTAVVDVDDDGFGAEPCGDDCDDGDPQRRPDATETCNLFDDDCDGDIDECDGPGEVCSATLRRCLVPSCGDGSVDGTEQCDHGGAPADPSDGCTSGCRIDYCETPTDLDGLPLTAGWVEQTFDFGDARDTMASCGAGGDGPERVFTITATGTTLELQLARVGGGSASADVAITRGSCPTPVTRCGRSGGGETVTLGGLTVGELLYFVIDDVVDAGFTPRRLRVRFLP